MEVGRTYTPVVRPGQRDTFGLLVKAYPKGVLSRRRSNLRGLCLCLFFFSFSLVGV